MSETFTSLNQFPPNYSDNIFYINQLKGDIAWERIINWKINIYLLTKIVTLPEVGIKNGKGGGASLKKACHQAIHFNSKFPLRLDV